MAERRGTVADKLDLTQVIVNHAIEMQSAAESPLTLPAGVMGAVKLGYPFTAIAWVKAGGDVDAIGSEGTMTMLMIACMHGRLHMVDTLIKVGKASIDVNTGSDSPASAIVFAAAKGYPIIVQRLIDAGSRDVFTAIAEAGEQGHTATINVLSTHIKKVQASLWSGAGKELPKVVAAAAAHGVEATVLAWIEGGGSVDATYSYPKEEQLSGMTLLHFACGHDQPSIVSLLLKHGADTNLQDSRGVSPLISCAWQGYASIVSRL